MSRPYSPEAESPSPWVSSCHELFPVIQPRLAQPGDFITIVKLLSSGHLVCVSPILGAGEMMTPNGRCHPPHTRSPTKHFIWPNYIECSQSLKHGDCPYSLSKVGKSRYLAKLHRAEPGVSPPKPAFQVRKGSQEIKFTPPPEY